MATLDFSQIGDPYSISTSKSGIDPAIQDLLTQAQTSAVGNIGAGNDPTSTSTSVTGFDPNTLSTAQGFMSNLNSMIPQYNQAVQGYAGLPGQIDKWTEDTVKNYRLGGDDIINTLNAVANDRASKNILGGTEATNLRSNMLSQLMQQILGLRANVESQGTALKAGAVSGLPGATQAPINALTSLIPGMKTSTSASDQIDPTAWAGQAANLLGLNKLSTSDSYQTDPTAMAKIMASLLQSNY